jgi:predicted DNA-binding transcriptional regulator YafY
MPKNKAFHRRIQVLDQCLRRRQKVWTVNALLEATNAHLAANACPEISVRTLYEDLKYLQETLDAPVEKFHQGKQVCYRYSDPAYTLVNSPLSPAEKEILRKMLEYMRVNALPMQAEIEALLNRHGVVLIENQSLSEASMKIVTAEDKTAPRLKKAESAVSPAPRAMMSVVNLPEETIFNQLVLRMESEDFSSYRDSFWKWLESEA